MYELRIHKSKLRNEYISRRKSIDISLKDSRDQKICSSLLSLASYRYSKILLMYFPCRDEIDIKSVIEQSLKDGKKVALPRCRQKDHSMCFHFIDSLNCLEPCGAFGIPEPPKDTLIYDPQRDPSPAVCIVPAILYDREGFRIGYGKGYYDRYLPIFSGTRIGLTYSDFIIDKVPRGRYDLSVDVIITEKGIKAIHNR